MGVTQRTGVTWRPSLVMPVARRLRLLTTAMAGVLFAPASSAVAWDTRPHMAESRMQGEVITGRYRGTEGERAWRLFVPSTYNRAAPPMLMVVLHGCTQSADDIARGSQMDVVAETRGFLVLYPEQSVAANVRTCWNWFDAAHQARGGGEPALIAAMIADVMRAYPADEKRVHLVGISAGAAMAGLVGAAYPERFASLTSASGIGWRGAQNVGAALSVMQRGAGTALPSSEALIAAMGDTRRALPVFVIHGGADKVVSPANADETIAQWVGAHNVLRTRAGLPALTSRERPTQQENGYDVSTREWSDNAGLVVAKLLRIEQLGHAWSGGSVTGTFADAKGPNASALIAEFCLQHRIP